MAKGWRDTVCLVSDPGLDGRIFHGFYIRLLGKSELVSTAVLWDGPDGPDMIPRLRFTLETKSR